MSFVRSQPMFVALAMAAALVGASAAAQTASNGRTSYEATFFQQFAPANALEIVQRVPGFVLDIGDTEVRGFGQAAGNVVINGQRPSAKSDTLETVLARIPANRVLRVEIGPGDLFGAEFAGRSQVVNLVLATTGGLAGTAEANVRREYTGALLPEGNLSALLKRGRSTFNGAVGFNNNLTGEEGIDRLVELPSGRVLEFRRKVNDVRDPNGYLSASWAHDAGANRTAHLNGRFALERLSLTQANAVSPAVGPARDDRLTQRYRRREFEVGGDVTRPFAGGGLKLIGLATRRYRLNRDASLLDVGRGVSGGFEQELDDTREETVLRGVWSRPDFGGWSVEAGLERALNRLDSEVDLFAIDAGGGRTRIDLPVDDAVVQEYRGEAFVNAGRALSPKVRADVGLTGEVSRLTVRGDAQAERVLKFLKPRATLDWRPTANWRAQLSVVRTVAQLQFEDFISAAELTNDRVNGGNAELVPQRAWEVLLIVERKILGDGLVKLEFGQNRISLVQDRVPTPEGFDAPGNLGDGRANILRLNLDAPLKRFGVKGGRFTGRVSIVDTSVVDPYTLEKRRFSGNALWVADASFRQDLGEFAWGFSLFANSGSTVFRRNELDRFFRQDPYATAFAEYRPTSRTTIGLAVDNFLDHQAFRERSFFQPNRTNRTPNAFERRERNQHVIPRLTIKHSFG